MAKEVGKGQLAGGKGGGSQRGESKGTCPSTVGFHIHWTENFMYCSLCCMGHGEDSRRVRQITDSRLVRHGAVPESKDTNLGCMEHGVWRKGVG